MSKVIGLEKLKIKLKGLILVEEIEEKVSN